MKLLKTIFKTTLALLAAQLLFYCVLFVGWFFRFIMQWFVTFGSPQEQTWIESLLEIVMKVLKYPARPFFKDSQASGDTFTLVLQLAIGSVIWGVCLGVIVYVIREWRRPANVT